MGDMPEDVDVDALVRRRNEEFVSTLSLELRGPLAPLRYALGVLRANLGDNPTTARARDVMGRQVENLIRLVDDLVDLSRVTSESFRLSRGHVDLASVIAIAVERSRPHILAAGHTLDVQLPDQAVWLEGDAARLAQAVHNLLTNAARFTERGGRVTIRAEVAADRASITVADNGRGFAPEDGERIFGLGIGLALARTLTELHGGNITAHSRGPGRGARVVVELPLAALPAEVMEQGRRRVLIADDNRDAADLLAEIIREQGHEVAVAYDGQQAVEAARAFVPDLVFLDIGMPVLDGYQAAVRIRNEAGSRRLVLVALTGWGQADDRRRAEDAGFDEHLVKPATLEALCRLLASATR
jgi:CheY-like chemotaxis protein/two-component sensor histidine kinase